MLSGEVPMIGPPRPEEPTARFKGVWPPNWTMTPLGFSRSTIWSHVLKGQGLEIEFVGGVIVRADRFRIAVDHDAGISFFLGRREAWTQQ